MNTPSNQRRGVRLWIIGIALLLVLAGCGNPPDASLPVDVPPDEPGEQTIPGGDQEEPEPEKVYPYTAPLTGLGSEVEWKEKPIMALIENSPQARPQSGLDQADLVYEILAEGEITRFVGVYQSRQPEVIGPIRSLRPYFVELGEGLDAYIVHAGYSEAAKALLTAKRLPFFDEIYGDGAYFWRDNTRHAPHNLYTNTVKIMEGVARKRYSTEWKAFTFPFMGKTDEAAGQTANHLHIHYIRNYEVAYTYDPDSQTYMREMAGEKHLDKETGQQLSATNIIIAEARHRVLDSEGRREIQLDGPGKGYLLQLGKAVDITWERKGGAIRAYRDGRELPLKPGQTWIQVVPPEAKITIQE